MTNAHTILFVSAAEGNVSLLTEFLNDQGYQAIPATSLAALDAALETHDLDLVLIDADGFPPAVWERCEQLQLKSVPFLVISQHGDAASDKGREQKAAHVFEKPVGQSALVQTITQLLDDG